MGSRSRRASPRAAEIGAGRVIVAFASLGAAVIHLASAADHYSEWWPAGVFFYAVAVAQAGWAALVLRRPGPVTMLLGLLGNAGVIAVWAVSRTTGPFVGPSSGVPEDTGRADVTAAAFGAVICLVALWCLARRGTRGFGSPLRAVLVSGAASAVVVGLTVPAVQAAMNHSHSHGTAEESTPHGHDEEDAEPQDADGGADEDAHEHGDEDADWGAEEDAGRGEDAGEASPSPSGQSAEPADPEHGHDGEPHGH